MEVMSQVALPSHRQSGVQKYLPQKMEMWLSQPGILEGPKCLVNQLPDNDKSDYCRYLYWA